MRRFGLLLLQVAVALLTAFSSTLAQGAILNVDRLDDPDPALASACTPAANDCSLRGAVINANGTTDADVIQLEAGTYTLTRPTSGGGEDNPALGDLDLTQPVTLIGVSGTVIDALALNDRAIDVVGSGAFSVTNLEVRGGRALEFTINYSGGGISNSHLDATLTLTGVTLRDNKAGDGGGVHSLGPLIVTGCQITENSSNGIDAWRNLTITDSAIIANTSGGIRPHAGGEVRRSTIANNGGAGFQAKYASDWMIAECTISGNGDDGVEWLDPEGNTLTVVNSTISDNAGTGLLAGSAAVNVTNSTIVRNQRGLASLISESAPSVISYRNTLIADNDADCFSSIGVLTSQGFNLDSDGTCVQQATDISAADPKLGPLANNGGPTQTVALLPGSPAIDKASNANAPATDQRGMPRPVDGDAVPGAVTDIGAYEVQLGPIGAASRKNHGMDFDVNLPLTGTPGIESRSGGATNDYTMVVTFAGPVTISGNPQAQVIAGAGTVGSGGASNGGVVTVSGSTVTVPLTNVTSQQTIQVRLNGVNGSSQVVIPMSVLVGDATADGNVNSGDAIFTRNRSGQSTNATNFRADYNLDGVINAGDATTVKARSGHFIP